MKKKEKKKRKKRKKAKHFTILLSKVKDVRAGARAVSRLRSYVHLSLT